MVLQAAHHITVAGHMGVIKQNYGKNHGPILLAGHRGAMWPVGVFPIPNVDSYKSLNLQQPCFNISLFQVS